MHRKDFSFAAFTFGIMPRAQTMVIGLACIGTNFTTLKFRTKHFAGGVYRGIYRHGRMNMEDFLGLYRFLYVSIQISGLSHSRAPLKAPCGPKVSSIFLQQWSLEGT